MKLLTKDVQATIARQMYNKARDIDVCIFNSLDESMDKEILLDCLMFYMNKDGGIGNALHIDNYNPDSSSFQVFEAYKMLGMVGFDSSCDNELFQTIISKTGNYLYNRIPPVDNLWNPNVITNNNVAHAIPFTYCDASTKLFGLHPTMALLGYTLLFNKPTKAYYKKALKLLPMVLDMFYNKNELTKYELTSANYLLYSLKKLNIFTDDISKIEAHILKCVEGKISNDFDDLDVIHPLDCLLYVDNHPYNDLVEMELDYIIDSVAHHGLWDYKGTWGHNIYAEEDSAKLKWIGCISAYNYFILKKYGRIE